MIKVNRIELVEILKKTQTIAQENKIIPVLSNILIEAFNKDIKISASNLEIHSEYKMQSLESTDQKTSLCLSCKLLLSICQTSESEFVVIAPDFVNNICNIQLDSLKINIQYIKAEEFPIFNKNDELSSSFIIQMELIQNALNKVLFSASDRLSQPYLRTVLLDISKSNLKTVATDSHRLALFNNNTSAQFENKVLFNIDHIAIINKMFEKVDKVKINLYNHFCSFETDSCVLSFQILESKQYPNYMKIFPKLDDNYCLFTINKNILTQFLNKAMIFFGTSVKKGVFTFSNNKLHGQIADSQIGEFEDTIAIEKADNFKQEMNIMFNPNYIAAVLEKINGNNVILGISYEQPKPILVLEEQFDKADIIDKGFTSIVMPMNI